ncbi:hypothetical protein QAD02_019741 [Eretmocerus hayati]|uniref:Uncharacterized protein n=1 Tax=Eretmocerus hayati TaxID=131215 RepID=A0ACC2PK29_9HYME|nr:hypothetical protein QAD02_019741 [Eretmocerus hayati]
MDNSGNFFFIFPAEPSFDCKIGSLQEHPYHAIIASGFCPNWGTIPKSGVIISDQYVITASGNIPGICAPFDFSVEVGADSDDNSIVRHIADVIEDDEITIFQLRTPIKFGRRAQPIQMVKTGEGPKSGDRVIITTLTDKPLDSTDKNVQTFEVTVLNEQDCMRSKSNQGAQSVENCQGSLWYNRSEPVTRVSSQSACTLYPRHCFWRDIPRNSSHNATYTACPHPRRIPFLVNTNGKLVGIRNYKEELDLDQNENIDSFLDVASYRDTIRNLTSI